MKKTILALMFALSLVAVVQTPAFADPSRDYTIKRYIIYGFEDLS